jgi:cbb3-type cytochrome oxidase subunit 3
MLLLDHGAAALDAFVVAMMVGSFVALGVICWIFWKAKKRDDAEEAARRQPPPGG